MDAHKRAQLPLLRGQQLIRESEDVRKIGETMVSIHEKVQRGAMSAAEADGQMTDLMTKLLLLTTSWLGTPDP
jgi:hypothetical protein